MKTASPVDAASQVATVASPRTVPRLALSVAEACEALGVSWDFWRQHVEPDIRMVRRGRRKMVPVRELERWLEREAEALLG